MGYLGPIEPGENRNGVAKKRNEKKRNEIMMGD
jgi:hypothetical protein